MSVMLFEFRLHINHSFKNLESLYFENCKFSNYSKKPAYHTGVVMKFGKLWSDERAEKKSERDIEK